MKTTSKGRRKNVTSSNGKQVRRTENVLRVEATKFFLPSQDRTETRKTKKGPYKNLNSRQRKKPLHAHLISFPSTKPWSTHSYEKENQRHQQPDSPSDMVYGGRPPATDIIGYHPVRQVGNVSTQQSSLSLASHSIPLLQWILLSRARDGNGDDTIHD